MHESPDGSRQHPATRGPRPGAVRDFFFPHAVQNPARLLVFGRQASQMVREMGLHLGLGFHDVAQARLASQGTGQKPAQESEPIPQRVQGTRMAAEFGQTPLAPDEVTMFLFTRLDQLPGQGGVLAGREGLGPVKGLCRHFSRVIHPEQPDAVPPPSGGWAWVWGGSLGQDPACVVDLSDQPITEIPTHGPRTESGRNPGFHRG